MSGLVEIAIEEALGPRCLDYDKDCTGCKTWDEFDRLTARVAELEGQVSYTQGLADFWMAKAQKLAAQIADAELVRAKP